jgi:sensor histidine kinase regulating citrate/malate metabolism
MHKDGDKRLTINFTEKDNLIICTVEDNGVGRKHSESLKANVSGKSHTSKGIQVSTERLKKMEQTHGMPGRLIIEDLFNTDQSPAGTRVMISFPN